ncbi:DgyrCDS12963 [Dimorphilus gyrociliatus]|uniref:DgyrCDS12963 n=1 Tax=Dimorphilus gyrociliatus TaxID=2664684 RepID=A0A7I8W9A0_9ANNE|nr:DgyrCDS12963 [Dimorphilus gyrociliatus]
MFLFFSAIFLFRGCICSVEIKVGAALLDDSFSQSPLTVQTFGGAINIALEDCRRNDLVNRTYKLSLVWVNDFCDSRNGPKVHFDLIEQEKVDILLGTVCSWVTKLTAPYALYKNIMVYSMSSADRDLQNKTIYANLVRAGAPNIDTIGFSVVKVLEHFNWKTVSIMSVSENYCGLGIKSVENIIRNRKDFRLAETFLMKLNDSKDALESALRKISMTSRIVVVCLRQIQIREMIQIANKLGMSANQYIFLYFTLVPDEFTVRPWGNIIKNNEEKKIKDGFESLIQLTLSSLAGPTVDKFLSRIPLESSKYPFYKREYLEKNWTVTGYSVFAYEVTYLLCNIINETVSQGKSVKDIDWMMSITKNRKFKTKFGDGTIDSNGDRLPNYLLWRYDTTTGSYRQWLNITFNTEIHSNRSEINTIYNHKWSTKNQLPPPDIPLCGFKHELCPPTPKGSIKMTQL